MQTRRQLAPYLNREVKGSATLTAMREQEHGLPPLTLIKNVTVESVRVDHLWVALPRQHCAKVGEVFSFTGIVVSYWRSKLMGKSYTVSRIEITKEQ